MANSLVVTLLLKTGAFSQDLKKAGGQVQQFKKGCDTAGKSVSAFGSALGIDVGALTKFGGAVGAAVVAGKTFKALIDSTQTSADNFAGIMYASKTAVNEFAYAISTFDFTNFNEGLSGLIQRARDAYKEIDQLADTLRGYSVLEAKAAAAVAHARKVGRDKNASKAEKEAAIQTAREAVEAARDGAQIAADQYVATLAAGLRAKGAKVTNEETLGLVENAIMLNTKVGREAGKARAEAEYKEYTKKMSALDKEFGGTAQTFTTNYGTYTYNNDQWKQNPEYQRRAAELADEYKESIVYNDVLIKQNDEQLNQTTQMITSVYRLNEQVDNFDTRLEGVENRVSGTTKSTKEQEEIIKESLSYWQKIAQESQKNRDNTVYMSDAWKEANTQLDEALHKIELINAQMERAKTNARYGDSLKDMLTPITGPDLKGQAINTQPDKLAGDETKKTLAELRVDLAKYKEAAENTFDPKLLAHYNQQMKAISDEIKTKENLGLDIQGPDSKVMSEWDHFNDAMANTSTIVSNLAETFQEGTKVTAASILRLVSTSLPALSSLITAFAALAGVEATEKAVQSSKHWIEAIAAVAALGAAVASAISSAKSQRFANGGIVGGTSFTGDRVTAQVNSGEMVLTKAQQANLFKMANSGVGGGGQVEFHISGTDLVGVLNNANRKNNLIR